MTTSLHVGGDGGSRLVLPVIPFEERPRPDFVAVPMGERGPEGTWPGRSRTIRDDLRQTTRVEWSGSSDSESPWGRVFDRERLTYEVDDARPEAAAVRGETETDVHLPGRSCPGRRAWTWSATASGSITGCGASCTRTGA